MAITPDLSFNLIQTLYALFIHNYLVIAYFVGMVISIFLQIKHPSRYATFFSLGFGLLLFGFEYDKHIVDGLRQQTLQSLITTKPHYTLQRWINLTISDILPVVFFTSGWILVYLGIISRPHLPSSPEHKSL